ncbi:MAG TPA: hemerythrin domain-containing protein [Armatimonadota bacterium]|nr:hemerythrin domain-containing protein [Armatimonadota bacterium]
MITDLFESAPTFDDPLGMLRACHRRIERALDVTERIVEIEREGPLDGRTREALARTLQYFRVGVPRHSADEEESLFPRLRGVQEIAGAANTAEYLVEEHEVLDAAHRELDTLGDELLAEGRFASPEKRDRFGLLVRRLRTIYREHIRVEDEELFPAAESALRPEELESVGAEMAGRRGIDWQQHRETLSRMPHGRSGLR